VHHKALCSCCFSFFNPSLPSSNNSHIYCCFTIYSEHYHIQQPKTQSLFTALNTHHSLPLQNKQLQLLENYQDCSRLHCCEGYSN
jgi:hypothetical protein